MNKKILITLFLVFILIANVVFAADSLSVNSKELDKKGIKELDKKGINDDKKQEITNKIEKDLKETKETDFFDNIIVNGAAQFNDYASMVEAYAQLLYVDELHVEDLIVNNLNIDNLEVDDAWIEELGVNGLWVNHDARFDEDVTFENFDQTNSGNEYAFACLDSQGGLFRSDIPCNEINSSNNSGMEVHFSEVGQTMNVDFQGQDFEIKLVSVNDEAYPNGNVKAVFRVNGDYEDLNLHEEISLNGLHFEFEQISFANGEFESLGLQLEEVVPTDPIIEVEDFPFEYEFSRLYENLRFGGMGIPEQDIEIIAADSDNENVIVEVNDDDVKEVEEGDNISIGGINLYIESIEFDDNELKSMKVTVYGVDNNSNPTTDLYPTQFINSNGEFNGLFVAGSTASTQDVVYLINIAEDMDNYAYVPNNATVLDTEVEDIEDQNIITVGTACDNIIIAEALGNPINCAEYEQEGVGIIHAVETGDGIYTLMIDGYDFAMRNAAKEVLLDWSSYSDSYDLRDGPICVRMPTTNELNSESNINYVVTPCD